MKHLPWVLLALVLAYPLFAQGHGPRALIHASLVKSVPIDVHILGQPHPRDYVRVEVLKPYTVPAGRFLVVTGVRYISVETLDKSGKPATAGHHGAVQWSGSAHHSYEISSGHLWRWR